MTGNDAWQATWPVQGAMPISGLADAVHARIGGLVGNEPTQVYGAVTAATIGVDPDMMLIPVQRIEDLAAVLVAGRARPCLFCGGQLAVHTLTVSSDAVGVWCVESEMPRPAADWLAGPVQISPESIGRARLMWIGIPGFSFGILSWLPSLIAGVRQRRRSWLIAAATFGLLTGVVMALQPADDSDSAWSWLMVGLWSGSMIYGALQVKPWLASQPATSTAHSIAGKDTGVAYGLMLFSLIGVCGIQHFYLGKVGRGLVWLFTFGLFGIGLLVDLVTMPQQVRDVNARRNLDEAWGRPSQSQHDVRRS